MHAADLHLDNLLVIVAVFLLIIQLLALRGGQILKSDTAVDEPGGALLRILSRVSLAGAVAQGLMVICAVLLALDPVRFIDPLIILLLISQLAITSTSIWSVRQIRQLPDHSHWDYPSIEGSEPSEGVSV